MPRQGANGGLIISILSPLFKKCCGLVQGFVALSYVMHNNDCVEVDELLNYEIHSQTGGTRTRRSKRENMTI